MTDLDGQARPEPPIAGDETATLLGSLERERGLEQLARYTTSSGESPSLRRILIDMIEEYARHVGHADLIRESVDGLTGEDPPG
jgi:hypothetical protein